MLYNRLKEQLKNFIVFSLNDIRKIEPKFYRRRLNEWQDKGYIKKLRRGYYMFAGVKLNEEALFLVANRLYSPSYISFEMAFSYYGLIPESVYGITSATTRKTSSFKTPLGEFSYRRIKPSLMFGYRLVDYQGQNFKIAEIEKALLDYFYLNPHFEKEADFYELRFNSEEFLAKADMVKLDRYLEVFNNLSLRRRVKNFLTFIKGHK
jgi:predicted transcriptional regulator of viral defense system